jgi:hypothetical protein
MSALKEDLDLITRAAEEAAGERGAAACEAGCEFTIPPPHSFESEEIAEAICELHNRCPSSQSVAPDLLGPMLLEQDDAVKILACAAFKRLAKEIVEPAAKVLSLKMRGLTGSLHAIRWLAAVVLALAGEDARSAIPKLIKRLSQERHSDVRLAICWALREIDVRDNRVQDALALAATTDKCSGVTAMCESSLGGSDLMFSQHDHATPELLYRAAANPCQQ